MYLFRSIVFLSIATGCTGSEDPSQISYNEDVKPIIDEHCVSCHTEGDIAPFPLDSYLAVEEVKDLVVMAVENESMPPWPPNDECNTYQNVRKLSEASKNTLTEWATGDAAEGNSVQSDTDTDTDESLPFDVSLQIAEPYTATQSPDDYRCHVIEWPNEEEVFVTGFQVFPDQAALVHHVIAFGIAPEQAELYRGYDEAEEGPGYTCFGSPNPVGAGGSAFSALQWLGSWAPGGRERAFPEDTGIRVRPGSLVVVQVHYNTTTVQAVPDQTQIKFRVTDSVEKPAVIAPYTNPTWLYGASSMAIPAGEESVSHSISADIIDWDLIDYIAPGSGINDANGLQIHSLGLHMHQLGKSGRLSIQRANGDSECLLQIDDWDFNWQGSYFLEQSTVLHAGDKLKLECEWDNSAANQPVIDGVKQEPQDVAWGEGTGDEMCLGILYMTEP
jgi:hypothetical protein